MQFVRAGVSERSVDFHEGNEFLNFFCLISLGRFSRRILGSSQEPVDTRAHLPLNPLFVFNSVVNSILHVHTTHIEHWVFQPEFVSCLQNGFIIPSEIWENFVVDISEDNPVVQLALSQVDRVEAHPTGVAATAHDSNTSSPAIGDGPSDLVGALAQIQTGRSSLESDGLQELNTVQQHSQIQRMISNEKAAIDVTQLRRSTRSTRYDGFRIPQPTDVKPTASKVKARIMPAMCYRDQLCSHSPAHLCSTARRCDS